MLLLQPLREDNVWAGTNQNLLDLSQQFTYHLLIALGGRKTKLLTDGIKNDLEQSPASLLEISATESVPLHPILQLQTERIAEEKTFAQNDKERDAIDRYEGSRKQREAAFPRTLTEFDPAVGADEIDIEKDPSAWKKHISERPVAIGQSLATKSAQFRADRMDLTLRKRLSPEKILG